jgi:hypothetical protein
MNPVKSLADRFFFVRCDVIFTLLSSPRLSPLLLLIPVPPFFLGERIDREEKGRREGRETGEIWRINIKKRKRTKI